MGALIRIAIALLLFAIPAPGLAHERWAPFINEAAARFGIPEGWIMRVIAAESGGRTHVGGRPIRSRAGAMGLMQLMPATWDALRIRLGLGTDPDDPRDNILAGTFYLRLMHDRFGYPGLFGAYNAGPARYARHIATGETLPRETRDYIAALAGGETRPDVDPGAHSGLDGRAGHARRSGRPDCSNGLFFRLSDEARAPDGEAQPG